MRETSASRSCWRNPSTPLASMAANVTPSMPGAPLLAFAAAYAVRSVSSLPTWTDQSPESPGRFGLRLGVDPPLQVLQPDRRPCHCVSASRVGGGTRTAGSLRSGGITRPPRYSGPIRHRLVVRPFPEGFSVIGRTQLPPLSRRDEDGFSSCSACPVSPCCPYHPAEVSVCLSQRASGHAAFAPDQGARPSGLIFLEATCGFTRVTAR